MNFINNSCFLPNQDHPTRSQLINSKFTRMKSYNDNHNQVNKSLFRITTQQSRHSQQQYIRQFLTMKAQKIRQYIIKTPDNDGTIQENNTGDY